MTQKHGHDCLTGNAPDGTVSLMAVKGLAAETMRHIVERRSYDSMDEFLERVRPGSDEVRALVHAGALDILAPGCDRAEIQWQAAHWQHLRSDARSSHMPSRLVES